MSHNKKNLPAENDSTKLEKELNYLQRLFPWKSKEEITAIFNIYGQQTYKMLKQSLHEASSIEYLEY